MGLRPARTIRNPNGQPWARVSQRRPRKSFVKGAPRAKVRQYDMGFDKPFEVELDLVARVAIQTYDNSVEAARQTANKHLEKVLIDNYYFKVLKFPHLVLREHTALGVAGADRISKGMKLAFGRPKGRLLRLNKGDSLFRVRVMAKDLETAKKALTKAMRKVSGVYAITEKDIRGEKRTYSMKAFKKLKEEKKEEEAAAATTEGAPAEGEAKEATAGKDAKAGKEEKKK